MPTPGPSDGCRANPSALAGKPPVAPDSRGAARRRVLCSVAAFVVACAVAATAARADYVEVFEEFQASGRRIVFAVDEHGHLSGLVTLTDLLEEISGEMIERGDLHKVLYRRIEKDRVVIPARMEIRFFNEEFGTELETVRADTAAPDTSAGGSGGPFPNPTPTRPPTPRTSTSGVVGKLDSPSKSST